MRFGSTVLFSALCITAAVPAFAAPHARRGPTCQRLSNKKASPSRKPVSQRGIDSERVTQIQTALIAHGYLSGSPTGTWSPETQDALRKLQADNGWPTKVVPDSRAIIKLGLGPGSTPPESASAATTSNAPTPETIEAESSTPVQQ